MYYYKKSETEQIVYVMTYFGVLEFFFCFALWQVLERLFVAALLRKLGLVRFKNRSMKKWMTDFPWLWGRKFVYPLHVVLRANWPTGRRYSRPNLIYRRTWDHFH